MSEASPSTRSKRSRATLAQRALASLVAGVEEISVVEQLTGSERKNTLRQGLRNRRFAPAKEFTRLQIARLEHIILKLLARIQNGDLEVIDPALKMVDRLDRHHGFMKAKHVTEQYSEEDRVRLLKKVNEIADRLQPRQPAE